MDYTNNTNTYVNLGLPSGTLWATCNIGASRPEDFGLFFSDRALSPEHGDADKQSILVHQSHCPFCGLPNVSAMPLTTALKQFGHQLLGMPTDLQMKELLSECSWIWTGGNSYRVISRTNNNEILLPAAGWYIDAAHQAIADRQWSYDAGFLTKKELSLFLVDYEKIMHIGISPASFGRYLTRKTSQPLAALGLKGGSQVLQFDAGSRKIITLPGDIWMPIRPVICL